jgi:hypothetical protein
MLSTGMGQAQSDTSRDHPVSFSGYAEIYYHYAFNKPSNNSLPAFLYNYGRVNEVSLNLAYMKASYATESIRANIALAAGTYMNANYAAESGVWKNVYEADIGVKISGKQDLWIDAGIMPSHIGFESAVGKDNWTLTRSLAAENSPYFETGVKLGYTSQNSKWYMAALYLNGWQRIQRADGNSTAAFGLQLTCKPSSRVMLNYSNFAGSDKPDSVRQMRWFHDLYAVLQLSEHWGITAGLDYGMEQKQKGGNRYDQWYAPVVIIRYLPSEKVNMAARAEYYCDENGVIISTGTPNGFKTLGFSANIDYHIRDHVMGRLEARDFTGKDDIFIDKANMPSRKEVFLSAALAISF